MPRWYRWRRRLWWRWRQRQGIDYGGKSLGGIGGGGGFGGGGGGFSGVIAPHAGGGGFGGGSRRLRYRRRGSWPRRRHLQPHRKCHDHRKQSHGKFATGGSGVWADQDSERLCSTSMALVTIINSTVTGQYRGHRRNRERCHWDG